MNLLVTIPSLEVGGAEIFLVRLLNYLSEEKGIAVFLLDFEKEKRDPGLTKQFSTKIRLLKNPIANTLIKRLLEKTELVLKLEKDFLLNKFYSSFFKRIIREHSISVVHSHLHRSDKIVSACVSGVPTITTLHGCYNFFETDKIDEMYDILKTFNKIIYISDRNLKPFEQSSHKEELLRKTIKVYNGLQLKTDLSQPIRSNQNAPLKIVIVSRCIKEKGWHIVIEAVKRVNKEKGLVELQLVGDGEHLAFLKEKYAQEKSINFQGKVFNVNEHILQADLCCFPSLYKNESFPNSILEYLSLGKPVISTNLGEVENMMTVNGEICGFLSDKHISETALVDFFEEKINLYLSSPDLLEMHGERASQCIKQFDITITADKYLRIYKDSISDKI